MGENRALGSRRSSHPRRLRRVVRAQARRRQSRQEGLHAADGLGSLTPRRARIARVRVPRGARGEDGHEGEGAPAQRQLDGHHLPRPGAQLRLLRLAPRVGDVRHAARLSRQGGTGQRAPLPGGCTGLPEGLRRRQDVHVHAAERLPVLGRLTGDRGELCARDRAGSEPEDGVARGVVPERRRRRRQGAGGQGHAAVGCHREGQHPRRPPDEGRARLHVAHRHAVLLRGPARISPSMRRA